MINKVIYIKNKASRLGVAYITLFFLLLASGLTSQNVEDRPYNLVTNSNTLGIGYSNILDPYLSPFEYIGTTIGYKAQRRQYFSHRDTLFSVSNQFYVQIGEGEHPTRINSMLFLNGNYDLGFHYHWRSLPGLTLLLGGSWDVDLGGKYIARNVNNPFSLDIYSNINASLSVNYKFGIDFFHKYRQNLRIEYGMKTPLVGCMFVPQQGVSYYELFSLNNLTDAFHLSSIHNRRAVSQSLNLDIPVSFTTFRIGVNNDLLQYKVNNIVYHNYNFTTHIGCLVHFYVFQGTKNKPPRNFKSAY
ncbi:MAG: DUF3316 domain-containing protein [Paludibacteraceae bacterium]